MPKFDKNGEFCLSRERVHMLRRSSQCVERKKLHNDGFYSEIRIKSCEYSEINSYSSLYVSNLYKNSPKNDYLKLFGVTKSFEGKNYEMSGGGYNR